MKYVLMAYIFAWLLFSKSSWLAQTKVCILIWKWCELKEQMFCKRRILLREITHTALSSVIHRHDCVMFSLPPCSLTFYPLRELALISLPAKSTTQTENLLAQKLLQGLCGWSASVCSQDPFLDHMSLCVYLKPLQDPFFHLRFLYGTDRAEITGRCVQRVLCVCEVSHMTLSGS